MSWAIRIMPSSSTFGDPPTPQAHSFSLREASALGAAPALSDGRGPRVLRILRARRGHGPAVQLARRPLLAFPSTNRLPYRSPFVQGPETLEVPPSALRKNRPAWDSLTQGRRGLRAKLLLHGLSRSLSDVPDPRYRFPRTSSPRARQSRSSSFRRFLDSLGGVLGILGQKRTTASRTLELWRFLISGESASFAI